jgi:hypothetical protein
MGIGRRVRLGKKHKIENISSDIRKHRKCELGYNEYIESGENIENMSKIIRKEENIESRRK